MATNSTTLLDHSSLANGDRIAILDAPDLGDSRSLEICVTVHTAAEGDSPAILIQHAPTQDDDAWLAFATPVRVSLARTGKTWIHAECFTRFVGWETAGILESEAIVSVALVGKS